MHTYFGIGFVCLVFAACKVPAIVEKNSQQSSACEFQQRIGYRQCRYHVSGRTYFTDPDLTALIDTALKNNQELNITLQEIDITWNEIRARRGEYLPFVGIRGGAGLEKVGRYTSRGAMEATTEIKPGKEMPEPLPDFMAGLYATWELDIWHKLRNAKKQP